MLLDIVYNKLLSVISRYKDRKEKESYVSGISGSYVKLTNKKALSGEQKKEIEDYFMKLLGVKVPLHWHQYFYSRTGRYFMNYIPTSEYKVNIVGRLNVYPLKRAYTDKNMTDLFLPFAPQPKIYLKNMNGYFYFEGRPVSREEAVSLCSNLGEVIIKPSLTARGKGVAKHCLENGISKEKGIAVGKLLDSYRSDFLIQECIRQHSGMAALNPTSLNTIRILTYRSDMEIKVLYSVVRIGRAGQVIDNESAGGISTYIDSDGKLGKFAYGAPGMDDVEYTDSGVCLHGYALPSFDKAVNLVKQCHYQLPFFDIVAWDIAINEEGNPVLIEFNMTPDLSQSANGPAFGEFTEEIIGKAMSRKNTYSELGKNFMWKSF